jgi:hypothetical protein
MLRAGSRAIRPRQGHPRKYPRMEGAPQLALSLTCDTEQAGICLTRRRISIVFICHRCTWRQATKSTVEQIQVQTATLIRIFVHVYTVDHYGFCLSYMCIHDRPHQHPSTTTPYQFLCQVPTRRNPTPISPPQHRLVAALPGLQHR